MRYKSKLWRLGTLTQPSFLGFFFSPHLQSPSLTTSLRSAVRSHPKPKKGFHGYPPIHTISNAARFWARCRDWPPYARSWSITRGPYGGSLSSTLVEAPQSLKYISGFQLISLSVGRTVWLRVPKGGTRTS